MESLEFIGGGDRETGKAEELVDNLLPSETTPTMQRDAGVRRAPGLGLVTQVQPWAHPAVTQDGPSVRCQQMFHEQMLLGVPPGFSASVTSFGRGR